MTILDLFSGIGGFTLGLQRAGMTPGAFCEIDPYCRKILALRWPGIKIYGDIKELNAEQLAQDQIHPDIICGGFPCQDISVAGRGAGLVGERSGLWREMLRLIGEVSPSYAIIENVSALRGRGLGTVLGQIAALGYDAEWHCIPACAIGAPHQRDRVWIVAYPDRTRLEGRDSEELCQCSSQRRSGARGALCDAWRGPPQRHGLRIREARQSDWWEFEPDVGRVAHGVPFRVDRIKALGNALVPQIAELIGRAILQTEYACAA